jgi:hypothetical protein
VSARRTWGAPLMGSALKKQRKPGWAPSAASSIFRSSRGIQPCTGEAARGGGRRARDDQGQSVESGRLRWRQGIGFAEGGDVDRALGHTPCPLPA